jgi:hypothetical protein
MNTRLLSQTLGLGLLLAASASASAQTVRGANGHYYTLVNAPNILWANARAAAAASLRCGQPGHLVTITSPEEQNFLVGAFGVSALGTKWLGAYQPVSSAGATGWAWVIGEPFAFQQWNSGEPNNGNYGIYGWEDAAVFWDGGNWNDAPSLWPFYGGGGYVIEWDVDATVIVAGCDTGVPNLEVDSTTHCTIADLVAQCAAQARNHGDFVSCVAKLTNELKKAGLITGEQKGRIQSCAAQAAIP